MPALTAKSHNWFQSTPVIANGRIVPAGQEKAWDGKFQSTPVIANGRIQRDLLLMTVSDLFQSTPVIANGRIVDGDLGDAPLTDVSIHARYC